jgi:hypothetical protein
MSQFDPQILDDPQLPAALRGAIRELHPPVPVPLELDDRILGSARLTYRARQRRSGWVRGIAAGLAAAAAIAIAFRVFIPVAHSPPAAGQRPQLAQVADINHDGRVDILDAYTVARHIARHDALDRAWDINGDGVVDQKDVDLIAHLAVQTTPEASQ